jgi:aspartyl-tRNA(Asn)/glutamyl-tRNA(Gln) amidotransferase subunit C
MSEPEGKPEVSIDVQAVARLARLSLSPDEADRLGGQLAAIVGYVTQLAEVDLEGVQPMTHAAELALGRQPMTLRADETHAPLGADAGLAAAPAREGPLVMVPRIIGEAP